MIHLPILLAADVAGQATVTDALPYLLGFLVVLVTLTILWGICAATGWVLQRLVRPAVVLPPAPAPVPAPVPAEDAIPLETIVVIAAAVAAATGQRRRIVSIQPLDPAWSQAGRQQILTSHQIR